MVNQKEMRVSRSFTEETIQIRRVSDRQMLIPTVLPSDHVVNNCIDAPVIRK